MDLARNRRMRRNVRLARRAVRRAAWRFRVRFHRRRVRRVVIGVALGAVSAASLAAVFGATLARSAPAWWVTIRREDPATIQTARNVENRVMSRVYQDDENSPAVEEWTVEIPADQANAWLNVRLPMWLANQKDKFHWPREMSDLQVNFEDNRVTVGARVHAGSRDQVLTATIEPRLERDGRLFIPARWVSVGRLPIPADWVLDRAHKNAEQYIPANLRALPETETLFKAFCGEQAIRNNTLISLHDGRAIRVVSFTASHDTLRIKCRTERRGEAAK